MPHTGDSDKGQIIQTTGYGVGVRTKLGRVVGEKGGRKGEGLGSGWRGGEG